MSITWNQQTHLPGGGIISGITANAKDLWFCSPAGIFHQDDGGFTHVTRGIPFGSASAILSMGRFILAAGYLPHAIVRSSDNGRTWHPCESGQVTGPFTCFAASPNVSNDGVILAGSDGGGVLRSTDGGNSWRPSSFGLQSFHVLNIIWAPDAGQPGSYHEEFVFAATDEGVYVSPNGGRAWKLTGSGLPNVPILSLAITPDFSVPPILPPSSSQINYKGMIFAGSEGAGLFRSNDGGLSWQALSSLPEDVVNSLCLAKQGSQLIAAGNQGIYASLDFGANWICLKVTESPVLQVLEWQGRLLAATGGQGLIISADDGASWQSEIGLAAYRFNHMAALQPSGQSRSYAISGLMDGLWHTSGAVWSRVNWIDGLELGQDQPVIALQALSDRFLALTPGGLLSFEPDKPCRQILAAPITFAAMAIQADQIALAGINGEIWYSPDAGVTWQSSPARFRNANIHALHFAPDGLLYAVARPVQGDGVFGLWRIQGMGADWRMLLQDRLPWNQALIDRFSSGSGGFDENDLILAAGADIFVFESGKWARHTIGTPETFITALAALEQPGAVLAAKPGGLVLSSDRGQNWHDAGLSGETVTALTRLPGGSGMVAALTSTGTLYLGKVLV